MPRACSFRFHYGLLPRINCSKIAQTKRRKKRKKKTKICSFENLAWEIALCEETELCKTVMSTARAGEGTGQLVAMAISSNTIVFAAAAAAVAWAGSMDASLRFHRNHFIY